MLVRNSISDNVTCCCYGDREQESTKHIFMNCTISIKIWNEFDVTIGVTVPFIQVKISVFKW